MSKILNGEIKVFKDDDAEMKAVFVELRTIMLIRHEEIHQFGVKLLEITNKIQDLLKTRLDQGESDAIQIVLNAFDSLHCHIYALLQRCCLCVC